MTDAENEVLNRWKSRALRAEMQLHRAGLISYCPADVWSDDAYLTITLEHKDGRRPHIDELNAARNRFAVESSAGAK